MTAVVVMVEAAALCALIDAINATNTAVRAILPTAENEDVVLEARMRALAALRAMQAMQNGPPMLLSTGAAFEKERMVESFTTG